MILGIAAVTIVVAAVAVYLVAGSASAAQAVAVGDNVTVYYTGSFTNGTVFQSDFNSTPFSFIAGANQVIPGFDSAIIGMKVNQSKTVTIPMNEAYGPVDPALFISVPISAFGNQTVKAGMVFSEVTQSGQQMRGMVTAVNATNATLDFNQPLAGHALVFTIKVIGIRK